MVQVQIIMKDFDARITASDFGVSNMLQAIGRDISNLQRDITVCMTEFKSSQTHSNNALVTLVGQVSQVKFRLGAHIGQVQQSVDGIESSIGTQIQILIDHIHKGDAKRGEESKKAEAKARRQFEEARKREEDRKSREQGSKRGGSSSSSRGASWFRSS